jgi:hypothetical protein
LLKVALSYMIAIRPTTSYELHSQSIPIYWKCMKTLGSHNSYKNYWFQIAGKYDQLHIVNFKSLDFLWNFPSAFFNQCCVGFVYSFLIHQSQCLRWAFPVTCCSKWSVVLCSITFHIFIFFLKTNFGCDTFYLSKCYYIFFSVKSIWDDTKPR